MSAGSGVERNPRAVQLPKTQRRSLSKRPLHSRHLQRESVETLANEPAMTRRQVPLSELLPKTGGAL
jgi:hypothetical protein